MSVKGNNINNPTTTGGEDKRPKEEKITISLKAVKNLMQNNPRSASTITKMSRSNLHDVDLADNVDGITGDTDIAMHDANKVTCDYLKIFPELRTAILTMVGLTLSPRNSMDSEANYVQKKKVLPNNLSLILMRQVIEDLEDNWGIRDSMYENLVTCAMGVGAVAKAIIPENSLDHVINGKVEYSPESLSPLLTEDSKVKPLNLLGPVDKTSVSILESFNQTPHHDHIRSTIEEALSLEVVDNFNYLKLPAVKEKVDKDKRERVIQGHHVYGLHGDIEEQEVVRMRAYDENERESIGLPTVMNLEPASLILVTSPVDKTKRLGAFVMINEEGIPVTNVKRQDDKKKEQALLEKINSGLVGTEITNVDIGAWNPPDKNKKDENEGISLYMKTGIQLLTAKLTNGLYNSGVDVSHDEQFFEILYCRALALKQTKLIFVPGELLAYFYVDVSDKGIGKNLLEDYNDLNSMRAALLYAEVDSAITSNIQHTEIRLAIDEDDPDPRATRELAISELLRARQRVYPDKLSRHGDLVNWLQKAAVSVHTEEVPGLPSTSVEYETVDSQRSSVDFSEVNEKLRSQVLTGILGDPSMMDDSGEVDFASVEEDKRMLTAKKIRIVQTRVEAQWSDYIRKLIFNDGEQRSKIKKILKEELNDIRKVMGYKKKKFRGQKAEIDWLFHSFVMNINIELPNPVTSDYSFMMDKLDDYISGLDTVMPYWISDELFDSELDGELSDAVDRVTESYTALFVREWMAQHGFMPELSRMISQDNLEGRVNLGKEVTDHKKGLFSNIKTFIEQSLKDIKKGKKIRGMDELSEIEDDADDYDTDEDDSLDMGLGDDEVIDDTELDDDESATDADDEKEVADDGKESDDETPKEDEVDDNIPKDDGKQVSI